MDVDLQMAAVEGEVGRLEGPNNDQPYGTWQGVSHAAWCASFAMWGTCLHGGYRWPDYCQFGWKGDAYCPYCEAHARKLGIWRECGPDNPPGRGWLALYDWTGWGGADHIGAGVWGTDDNWATFWDVEGNTGSPEGVHWVRRDWTYVRGFIAPAETGGPPLPSGPRELRLGLIGEDVRWLQARLTDLGYDVPGGIDGDFGSGTWQAVLNFQHDWVPDEHDGVVGLVTRGELSYDEHRADMHPPPPPADYPAWPGRYLRRGDTGDDVRTFQARLAERGWVDSHGLLLVPDGWFGPETDRVVRQFQENKLLEPDGIVGLDTWDAFWTEPIT